MTIQPEDLGISSLVCKKLKRLGKVGEDEGKKIPEIPEEKEVVWNEHTRRFRKKSNPETLIKKAWKKYREPAPEIKENDAFKDNATGIEYLVREFLTDNHIEFFEQPRGFSKTGRPDFQVKGRFLIFVDGCYWHSCHECGFPDTGVRAYDERITSALFRKGYQVLRICEHDIMKKDFSKLNALLEVKY